MSNEDQDSKPGCRAIYVRNVLTNEIGAIRAIGPDGVDVELPNGIRKEWPHAVAVSAVIGIPTWH